MELTDPRLLKALFESVPNTPLKRARMTKSRPLDKPGYQPASQAVKRRCSCGTCVQCIEDARWERIFQAKFADPYYYQYSLSPRRSSPWG